MVNYLEIGATVSGLLQAWLVMKNNRYNWIAYIIQMALMIAFSISVSLYGDAVNSGVYLIIGIVGFIIWNSNKKEKPIEKCSLKERTIYLIIMAIGTIVVYQMLLRTDDVLPLLDSITTVSSFIATYYMVTKKIDCWVIWFFNDLLYVLEYSFLPDTPIYLLLLNVVWTGFAIMSYINWAKIMKKEKNIKKIYFAGKFSIDKDKTLSLEERLKNDYR